MPLPLVVAVALLSVAHTAHIVALTPTPLCLTGLPLPSCSWSTGCWANATPLCAALEGAVVKATRPAAPAVPSAVNVTGLPVSPLAAAVSGFVPAGVLRGQLPTGAMPPAFVVWGPPGTPPGPRAETARGLPGSPLAGGVGLLVPAVVLRVQLPTVAMPLAFVVWVPPVTLPLPAAGVKVTVTPATGLPLPSCTVTAGGELTALPAGADCVGWLVDAIAAASPPLSVIAPLAGVSPVAPKLSV